MGKLMFEWIYWHLLLPGREMPGISSRMQTAGKHRPQTEETTK
jgi:sulfide:quinone oxidoreductase